MYPKAFFWMDGIAHHTLDNREVFNGDEVAVEPASPGWGRVALIFEGTPTSM